MITEQEMDALIDAIAAPIRAYIAREIAPLLRRIEVLEGSSAREAADVLAQALRSESAK